MAREDPYDQITRALARQRGEHHDNLVDRYTRSTSVASLSLDDLARTIVDVIKAERADLVAHMARLYKLSLSKVAASDSDEKVRAKNLHARVTHLESVIRSMQRDKR